MPGRYIATGLYSEVVVNRGSTVCAVIIYHAYNYWYSSMHGMHGGEVVLSQNAFIKFHN